MSWWSKHVTDPISKIGKEITRPFEQVGKEVERAVESVDVEDVVSAAAVINPALLISNLQSVTSGMQAYTAYKAGKEAKSAAERAAFAEMEATEEAIRVAREENRRAEAMARARAAASGLSGVTSELYIDALVQSGREDIDWLKKVGVSQYEARLEEGQSAYRQAQSQMWGSIGGAIPGVGNVVSMFM